MSFCEKRKENLKISYFRTSAYFYQFSWSTLCKSVGFTHFIDLKVKTGWHKIITDKKVPHLSMFTIALNTAYAI